VQTALSVYMRNHSTVTKFHVTTDGSSLHTMKLHKGVILESIPSAIKTEKDLRPHLPLSLRDKLEWMSLDSGKNLAFLWLNGWLMSSSPLRSFFLQELQNFTFNFYEFSWLFGVCSKFFKSSFVEISLKKIPCIEY